jgi:pSer/pThr/pTyr-binding forkhead associated (FHA) protein
MSENSKMDTRQAISTVGKIRLQESSNAAHAIELEFTGSEGFILGRSDTKSSYLPDVDLAVFKALDKGVSRRHAALVHYEGYLHIVDLSSVNGTFLNGQRLNPETPYPVCLEDKLVLGEMQLVLLQV